MKQKLLAAALLLGACASPRSSDIEQLASDDPERVKGAQEAIVERGQQAVGELTEAAQGNDLRLRRRAKELLARITGQWGGEFGLTWRRSFAEAVVEAREKRKPILLLNLFGKFDEEFC
jgi:hypothetical protein